MKNKKKILYMVVVGIGAGIMGLSVASAQTTDTTGIIIPTVPELATVVTTPEITPKINETNLDKIKSLGIKRIGERLIALSKLKDKALKSKLIQEQKDGLVVTIDEQIKLLSDLKELIKSGNDITKAKGYLKSLYTDYRIYGIFIPKMNLEIKLFGVKDYTLKLSDVFKKIQKKIDNERNQGKDITSKQKVLDDAKIRTSGLGGEADSLLKTVSDLKPADYPNQSKLIIASVNSGIKDIRKNLKEVVLDLKSAKK